MSWAEVKTINSDPSIPLNNLIGTNMRILENTDDRLSKYTDYQYKSAKENLKSFVDWENDKPINIMIMNNYNMHFNKLRNKCQHQ